MPKIRADILCLYVRINETNNYIKTKQQQTIQQCTLKQGILSVFPTGLTRLGVNMCDSSSQSYHSKCNECPLLELPPSSRASQLSSNTKIQPAWTGLNWNSNLKVEMYVKSASIHRQLWHEIYVLSHQP